MATDEESTGPRTCAVAATLELYKKKVLEKLKTVKGLENIDGENQGAILRVVSGNIAIFGTSGDTIFPSLELGVYGNKKKITAFKLDEAVSAIKDLVGTFGEQNLSPTFRNLMEPFAVYAIAFLAAAKARGEMTNLAKKMPKTCGKAPEVAFDFNSGINYNCLSNNQKSVVQRLNERLFSTEAEKSKLEGFLDQGETAPI